MPCLFLQHVHILACTLQLLHSSTTTIRIFKAELWLLHAATPVRFGRSNTYNCNKMLRAAQLPKAVISRDHHTFLCEVGPVIWREFQLGEWLNLPNPIHTVNVPSSSNLSPARGGLDRSGRMLLVLPMSLWNPWLRIETYPSVIVYHGTENAITTNKLVNCLYPPMK